jgi:hypothetical protein
MLMRTTGSADDQKHVQSRNLQNNFLKLEFHGDIMLIIYTAYTIQTCSNIKMRNIKMKKNFDLDSDQMGFIYSSLIMGIWSMLIDIDIC